MQLTRSRSPAEDAPRNPELNGHAPERQTPRRGRLRRATVLAGRAVLWAAILVLAFRGGVATVSELRGSAAPVPVAEPEDAAAAFPADAARAFATRFARDYLTYDPEDPSRPERLAAYMPDGRHGELGWDGSGRQTVDAAVAVDVIADSAERGAVVVAAQVSGQRWLHLSVPVVADRAGRLAVAGSPTLVAAPPLAAVPRSAEWAVDSTLGRELQPVLESFFDAYAAGRADDLAYYLPVGRAMDGLDGAVELDELVDLRVAEGGATRRAEATVRWRDTTTGAALTQRYELRLVDRAGRWYVDRLGGGPAAERSDDTRQGERDDR